VRASEVTLKPVTWLEFPFVPLGKITAVAGQMGQAKSLGHVPLATADEETRIARAARAEAP
jgi:hypothetical protein